MIHNCKCGFSVYVAHQYLLPKMTYLLFVCPKCNEMYFFNKDGKFTQYLDRVKLL